MLYIFYLKQGSIKYVVISSYSVTVTSFLKTVIEVLTVIIIFNKMFVSTDRESLPKAGANFPKQKACPGTDRQEEGTAICAQCWSRI